MYIREKKYDLTLNALGVANSCTTDLNGYLHSIRTFWDWNPAADHSLKVFRGLSTGSTQNSLFRVSGTTVSSSETWYEFFPRAVTQESSAATTGQQVAMYAIGGPSTLGDCGRLHLRITSSSGAFTPTGKVGTVVISVI